MKVKTTGTREIPLTQGKFSIVDAKDFDWLSQYKWQYHKNRNNGQEYVRVSIQRNGKMTRIYMHRLILDAYAGQKVDHRDGNGLNNKRSNLRLCTSLQNSRNMKIRKDNTSGYKGVIWHKHSKKWQANIKTAQGDLYLGVYDSKIEAASAYNIAARKYFGEFARLNDVKEIKYPKAYKKPKSKTGYIGVYPEGKKKKFRAVVGFNGMRIHLGVFDTALEAAHSYNQAALRYHGEFAKLNNMEGATL